MLRVVAVVSVAIGNLFDFVALFAQHHELFLRSFWCGLWFVETRKGFAVINDLSGWESLEAFCGHVSRIHGERFGVNDSV